MNAVPKPTATDLALGAAVEIQRRRKPRDWPDALAALPEDQRPVAEAYLRGIAARMRVKRDGAPTGRAAAAGAVAALLLVLALLPAFASPVGKLVVAMTEDTPAYLPGGGEPIILPRGTMIDICGAPSLEYLYNGRLVLLGVPCPVPDPNRIHRDGFE
jgi:hypothetical protein